MKELLEYYDVSGHYESIKRWYDGYQFGNIEVYCPWDVLNHCDRIRSNPDVQPENYWINTSSNDAVKRFIEQSANVTFYHRVSDPAGKSRGKKDEAGDSQSGDPGHFRDADHGIL